MRILFALLLLFSNLNCTRNEPSSEEDRFRDIQTEIDRKEYDQAETELKSILEQEPQNERARVILASISVAKAGITLKEYFLLEKISRLEGKPTTPLVDLKSLEKFKPADDSDFAKALEFLQKVDEVNGQYQEISEKFEQIPVVSDEAAENMQNAILELNKLSELQDGNALYRGVIKLFYFKYLWAHDRFFQFGEGKFCNQNLKKIADKLSLFESFTVGMIRDVSRGFPKSDKDFLKQVNAFDLRFKFARMWINSQKDAQKTVKQVVEKIAKDQKVEGFQCEF